MLRAITLFCLFTAIFAQQMAWSTVTTTGTPSARGGSTSVVNGGVMTLFGGQTSSTVQLTSVFSLNGATWAAATVSGSPTSARAFAASAVSNGIMYIFGGFNNPNYLSSLDGLFISNATWFPLTSVGGPSARIGHSAVMTTFTPGRMIIFGGHNAAQSFADLFAYDTRTNSWSALNPNTALPGSRAYHSAVITSFDVMVVWGGADVTGGSTLGTVYNDIWKYDFLGNAWSNPSMRGTVPLPRYYHSAGLVSSTVMAVLLGRNGGTFYSDIGLYDLSTDTWMSVTTTGSAPTTRSQQTATTNGGVITIFGGFSSASVYLNDVVRVTYTPATTTGLVTTNQVTTGVATTSQVTTSVVTTGVVSTTSVVTTEAQVTTGVLVTTEAQVTTGVLATTGSTKPATSDSSSVMISVFLISLIMMILL